MSTDVAQLAAAISAGDRQSLARAITLIESSLPSDRLLANDLLDRLLPKTGGSHRVGITGVPGVGKSTLINRLGTELTSSGKRVAVLAIDPSSSISGGSILGDKSRMHELAKDERAFIRPSPTAGTLGGVARRTRETLLLCEAAGFDVVIVETVGVGQSETAVCDMVDCFVLLSLPGAGDELQGIKRGVVELADIVAVNKADGDNLKRAKLATVELAAALRYMRPKYPEWTVTVRPVSGLTGDGIADLWTDIEAHRNTLSGSGHLEELRGQQAVRWMWTEIDEALRERVRDDQQAGELVAQLEAKVRSGETSPSIAARAVLASLKT